LIEGVGGRMLKGARGVSKGFRKKVDEDFTSLKGSMRKGGNIRRW